MKLSTYLMFEGNCREAFTHYEKVLGGKMLAMMDHKGTPAEEHVAPEWRDKIERLFLIDVVGFDWNCPQYITPRYTASEVAELVAPLKARLAELEAQVRTTEGP